MKVSDEADWQILRIVRVIDGDTFDAILTRTIGQLGDYDLAATNRPTKPARLRPIHLDTPEQGQPGHAEATADAGSWLGGEMHWAGLRVVTYSRDNFGRYLADVYATADRADTFSRHMLTEANDGAGWPAYRRGN